MAVQLVDDKHPELFESVADSVRFVLETRPHDPVAAIADRLLGETDRTYETSSHTGGGASGMDPIRVDVESAAAGAGPSSSSSSSSSSSRAPPPLTHSLSSPTLDDEESMRMRARASGKGRRGVVFSEPVTLDAGWSAVVVHKSEEERQELLEVIRANLLLGGIDEAGKRILVDAMSRKSFSAGDIIIRQGDPGDYFYVISSGTADVTVNGKTVLQVGKGRGVGELALLYDAPRAATVSATSDVETWAIDRDTFKRVVIGATMRVRELYAAFLSSVSILETLTHEEIGNVSDALQPISFTAGETIVRQGDTGADRFYIIEDGECKAEMDGVDGEVCGRLRRGAYFGERALLTDTPRAATVTAVTDTRCLVMDRAAFVRLMGPLTDILKRNMGVYDKYAA